MPHSTPESTTPQHRTLSAYPLCSLAPLLTYLFLLPVWQRHSRHFGGWTTDLGVVLGGIVALNCIWWFLRCPRQSRLVKTLTFLIMVAGVLRALANVYSNIAYRLYGG